jgi:small subunit ribosomal protein S1
MSKKDIFGDEVDTKKDFENFEQLFAASQGGLDRKLKVGDKITGEILSISKEEAFVSTGTPTDGLILTKDLMDENKEVKYSVGDMIEVVVTAFKNGEIRLSKKGSMNATTDSLEDAFDMELPVEGRVTEVVKGGFRVNVQGKTAFCPVSQIDTKFVTDQSEYVDKKFDFLVTQFDPRGRNIVVSRRRILELQKAEHEGTFMLQNEPGALLKGKVVRIERFGAFVELDNGIEGLIHISELGWSRIVDPNEVVTLGMPVQVKLLKTEEMDGGKLKISLSLKQADGEGNPWMSVPTKFPVGTIVNGKVEKKETYGLFVVLTPGVTGLLPKSKWRDSVDASSYENKKRGDDITVQVDQIMFEDRKISLRPPGEAEDHSWKEHSAEKGSGSGFASLGDALKGFKIK